MTAIMDIDIFADIICPWCYIGKKRLETAFSMRPELQSNYRWRGFLLNPSMPEQGMDRTAYLTKKFGHAAAAVYGRIAIAGLEAGIEFQFSKITRTPDTRPIHKLLIAAQAHADALSEEFYQAYFLYGQDISDTGLQAELCQKVGLDIETLESQAEYSENQLNRDLEEGQQQGIEGVPLIIFNQRFALAGAYPADILLNAMDAARLAPTTAFQQPAN